LEAEAEEVVEAVDVVEAFAPNTSAHKSDRSIQDFNFIRFMVNPELPGATKIFLY